MRACSTRATRTTRLRAGIRACFGFVRDHGAGWDVLFGGSGPAPGGELGTIARELRFRTVDQIAALFHIAVPDVDLEETRAYAHAASGAGEQLARWWARAPQRRAGDRGRSHDARRVGRAEGFVER